MTTFTKREILDLIPGNTNTDIAVTYILNKLSIFNLTVTGDNLSNLKRSLASLQIRRNQKLNAVSRMKARFEKINCTWLDSIFNIPIDTLVDKSSIPSTSHSGPGRPPLNFENKSVRSKKREISEISAQHEHNSAKILLVGHYAARRSGEKDLQAVLSELSKSPECSHKVRKLLDTISSSSLIIKKTSEEALAFILNNSFSKRMYTNMRSESKLSGADIWPIYDDVRKVKLQCRPPKEEVSITENIAEVSLQSLLNHTAQRIVSMQADVILQNIRKTDNTIMETILICSWGFDGSTGHSPYKQAYKDGQDFDDENLFVTSIIPLRLTTSINIILWNNHMTQSPKVCRPKKLEYVKESTDVILKQKHLMDDEIENLHICTIDLKDYQIQVRFSLHMTLIDGKVLNVITGTRSMQVCPICHATPKEFNNLSKLFVPKPQSLQYGIQPLHAWIKFFECCLHISYRKNIEKWQVRGTENKTEFEVRKKVIQKILWDKLGLKVDKPKPGGCGTSNDGNTARRAFQNLEIFADCLQFDRQLLTNFRTILITLSSQYPINISRFKELCDCTAKLYVSQYPWYPMPPSIHKILIHGAEIINSSILPVGMLGEEASEARNKDYKRYRVFHSSKYCRKANLEDIFFRAMDTSDPIISTINMNKLIGNQRKLPFPLEVIELFEMSEENVDEISDKDTDNDDYENTFNVADFSESMPNLHELDNIELSNDEDF